MKTLLAPLLASTLLAAAPTAAPSAAPERSLTVVCRNAHLYVFVSGTDRPIRARTFDATLGQRFGLLKERTTLESERYYETNIPVVEPGYAANAHYWINANCAIPTN